MDPLYCVERHDDSVVPIALAGFEGRCLGTKLDWRTYSELVAACHGEGHRQRVLEHIVEQLLHAAWGVVEPA